MSDILQQFRPRSIDEFIANKKTLDNLASLLREKDNYKLILLSGPSGIGKTTFARIFARAVGCEEEAEFYEFNVGDERKIDDAREIAKIIKSPAFIGTKVIVLDEAHAFTTQAQTALLTPVETGLPDSNYVIFCSTDPDAFLAPLRLRFKHIVLSNDVDEVLISRMIHTAQRVAKKFNQVVDGQTANQLVNNFIKQGTFDYRTYIHYLSDVFQESSINLEAIVSREEKYTTVNKIIEFVSLKLNNKDPNINWNDVGVKILNSKISMDQLIISLSNYFNVVLANEPNKEKQVKLYSFLHFLNSMYDLIKIKTPNSTVLFIYSLIRFLDKEVTFVHTEAS